MGLLINIRHLERKNVLLEGELTPEELELEDIDEVVHATLPLKYKLEAQLMGHDILVQGHLSTILNCDCVRCLKPVQVPVEIEGWACHLPTEGEDKVPLHDDCVDLTPFIREDILLRFPQNPVCGSECSGLPNAPLMTGQPSGAGLTAESSPWAALDKLKLEKE